MEKILGLRLRKFDKQIGQNHDSTNKTLGKKKANLSNSSALTLRSCYMYLCVNVYSFDTSCTDHANVSYTTASW